MQHNINAPQIVNVDSPFYKKFNEKELSQIAMALAMYDPLLVDAFRVMSQIQIIGMTNPNSISPEIAQNIKTWKINYQTHNELLRMLLSNQMIH